MFSMRISVFIVLFFLLLGGCGSLIQTQKINPNDINEGISYYLPKRPHNLIITAEIINPIKVKSILDHSINEYTLLNAEVKKLKEEWEKLQRKADSISDVGEAKKKAIEAAQNAEGAYKGSLFIKENAKNEMNVAKVNYQRILDTYSDKKISKINKILKSVDDLREKMRVNPQPEHQIALDKTYEEHTAIGCDYQFTMDIIPLALVPETRHPLILKVNHSHLRDDELKIKTTPAGLITTSDVITTDRTGDIIVEIAKAVAMFGVGPIPTVTPVKGFEAQMHISSFDEKVKEVKIKRCNYSVMRYARVADFEEEVHVDFFDENGSETKSLDFEYLIPKDLKVKVNNSTCQNPNNRAGNSCKSNSNNISEIEKLFTQDSSGNSNHIDYQTKKNGILYRRDETHEVQLIGNDKVLISKQITMPNLSPISLVPFNSLPLVKTKNNAEFENGMLTSFDTNQPSSVLELVRLPARVVEGMLTAITTLIQLKIDYTSKNTGLIGEEVKRLEAIQKFKNALKNEIPAQ